MIKCEICGEQIMLRISSKNPVMWVHVKTKSECCRIVPKATPPEDCRDMDEIPVSFGVTLVPSTTALGKLR